ncbi:sensor histidine kinase [Conexibacter woesei]|uniref:histidine kinase n=1 Tax=Conexibacter woesei (strain DSM 14684 / CCUG 47730 / CIP 108061 / JCM 11494 / NBRC 100937 / ID131577) TaxID=469383 RepID=D3FEM5_CONWI|nr:histidine kinase [Conexibacter woesei]ADB49699.1 integral membrane sensor signal transduction histidine kinase [Conexibacter woesei DSM 14684]
MPPPLARLRRAAADHPQRTDVVLALLVFAAAVPTTMLSPGDRDISVAPGVDWLRLPLAMLMTLPIAFRRTRPVAVLLVVGAAAVGAGLLGYSTGAAAFAVALALVSAAYYGGRRVAIVSGVCGGAIVLLMLLVFLPEGERIASENVAVNFAVIVLAVITGDVLRGHRDALAELAERNERLEQLRDVEKREAVAQDRMRIAREVHDIVGHALAAITLQARAGQRQITRDPAVARETFVQIEGVASRALGETREAVGVIRSGSERAELRPQPMLDDLPELVRAVSTSDVRVTLRRGDDGDVPPALQTSAYRIVQESLANVVKHARPATATVTVGRERAAGGGDGGESEGGGEGGDVLRVAVRDDGRGAAGGGATGGGATGAGSGAAGGGAAGGGHGLDGMRARAQQLGGTFAAGPADGGGWLVEARLPLRNGSRA